MRYTRKSEENKMETARMDQSTETLTQESEERGKSVWQGGELFIKVCVCVCQIFCEGRVIIFEGLRKSKIGYLMEELGKKKWVRVRISGVQCQGVWYEVKAVILSRDRALSP